MQKVVGINLNGNAYQLEEPGYEALRAYLERADNRLRSDPDRTEIMADLEQAIAEKCGRYLGANKNVVTAAEIDTIIAEMGPVESPEATAEAGAAAAGGGSGGTSGGAGAGGASDSSGAAGKSGAGKGNPRRLYQIREGAMLSGVCNGLAAFLDIDVTVVRVLFVIITFATFGAWIIAYLLMAFFIPYADTPEDRAAAYGFRLKAEELLGDNLQRASARARREWRRTWRREQRAWQRNWNQQWRRNWGRHWQQHMAQQTQAAMAAGAPPMAGVGYALAGISLPLVAVASAALFVAWILAMISVATTETLFGWPVPPELPMWASLLILFAIYLVISAPLHVARHAYQWGPYYAPWASISGLVWVGCTMLFFWLAYQHIPEVHALIDRLPSFWHPEQISLAEVASFLELQ